jgi:ParB/RepB/Spo0J family partition protein
MESQTSVSETATVEPAGAEFRLLPLDKIHESPSNPRKTFHKVKEAELEASVREKGVLVPIKVRPRPNGTPDGYEIVYGARRFRAALAAGRAVIPALVQVLSDKEVLEEQVVENLQRADVHPLEEAEGYRALIEHHGYNGVTLGAKVGKSKQYISERMKLLDLVDVGRQALLDEKLSVRVALYIARVPTQLQKDVVKGLLPQKGEPPIGVLQARDYIRDNFMLPLAEAPFSTTDATLVAAAGACASCPKKTGNQRELFVDVKNPDICTDPICFRSKVDAAWLQRVATAKAAGQKVLEPAEAKKVFESYDGTAIAYNSGYVDAHEEHWIGGDTKLPSFKVLEAAKPGASQSELVLARDAKGTIRELLPSKLVDAAVAIEQGKAKRSTKGETGGRLRSAPTRNREEEERERKAKLRAVVVNAAMPKIVEAVEKVTKKDAGAALRFVAERVLQRSFHDGLVKTARRREVKDPNTIVERLERVSTEGLAGLVVEVIAYDGASGGTWGTTYSDDFKRACAAFKIDLKALEAATVKASKEKIAAKEKPAKKAAAR